MCPPLLSTMQHTGSYPELDAIDVTIANVFDRVSSERASTRAAADDHMAVDYSQLRRSAAHWQGRLRRAGVRERDVVSVQLPNRWETLAILHAIWGLHAIANPITMINRDVELSAIFSDAAPRAVVTVDEHRGTEYGRQCASAAERVGIDPAILTIDDGPDTDEQVSALEHFSDSTTDAETIALLMFTSGTTGKPKGVLHTHRTLLYEAQSIADVFRLAGDRVFMPSPLAHITGLLYGAILPLLTEADVVLQDRWDARIALSTIERERCRFTVSATPFLRGLQDEYASSGLRSSLRVFVCGGADIPASLVKEAGRTMGTHVARTYGSTEMPTLSIVHPEDPESMRFATEGTLIGAAKARITDAHGDVGELEAIGPDLFAGYLDPGDNEPAFTADGWFRTGDLARIGEDGSITITGRSKDLIVRGGENISAKEVEDILITHPGVADVALVAVPDDVMGERVCAVIVATGATPPTLSELAKHLETAGIARQKAPEALLQVTTLPRTPSGKVQKFQLREQVAQAREAGLLITRPR